MAIKPVLRICTDKAGLEISAGVKEKRNGKSKREGKIEFRFFRMEAPSEGKTTQIKFIAEPFEGYEIFLKVNKLLREPGKEKLTHRFELPDKKEIVTNLQIEHWAKGDKRGFGFAIGRDNDFISVPITGSQASAKFMHAAEFCKFLSMRQCWEEEIES